MILSNSSLHQGNFPKIEHGDSIVQLGSCFSTHMTYWFKRAGFRVLDNPLGVIFHPVPLAKQILLAFGKAELSTFVQKEDVFVSYDASSTLYAMSASKLEDLMQNQLQELRNVLENAKLLIVTLGSAHGYRLKTSGELVANCHQQPQALFEKELSEAEDMKSDWGLAVDALKQLNPGIQIVFTVSPVRYVRDGLMENSLSKSELFRLVSLLKNDSTHYFPAFELVNDVLRDYRYFETDGVHPSDQAAEFVWDFLRKELFSVQTNDLIDEVIKLRKMEEHRLLYPESRKAEEYRNMVKQKRESFLSQYPVVAW
ncbi:GSCFA domain-containing protein [Fluviicola sp.]|uniref:GSCFA domain-containing protein n=1 Tax=Fluviicola sp. TaxID=1917219 RepID=UPI0031D4C82D